jgi:glutamate-1-semialdehyde 2,1-aminomutase
MKPLGQDSVIGLLFKRLARSREIDLLALATSVEPEDDALAQLVADLGYRVYRGDERDVLGRFNDALDGCDADVIVRITGDCPLMDPQVVDAVIADYRLGGADYVSNVIEPSFPDGLDVEVFSKAALQKAHKYADTAFDREHVTSYLRDSGNFLCRDFRSEQDLSHFRLTLDEPEDYEVIKKIVEHFEPDQHFSLAEMMDFLMGTTMVHSAVYNGHMRNKGAEVNSGQKLWHRAKKVIPAGNMLLSKRPEMFLPERWPAYFSRTNGYLVWDLDGNEYADLALMGVGTNLLGYNHDEVDDAVRGIINAGNMSSLNGPEEVLLAEKLVDMHDFAEMARFCRTGGEANAVAIRLARASTGREKIAFCGYHGWHDWYLAANLLSEDQLNGHLLSGLEPNGVPQSLKGSVLAFEYNQLDQLEALIRDHDLAAIMMEVVRNIHPEEGFLQGVRQLADKHGIVLIFDECTTGFRETFGGIHKKYGVEPDLAVFGKALGNGYAITAVIGTRAVMDAANSSFISSTFWTERIGSAAALKVLEIMEREKSWETVTKIGLKLRRCWQEMARRHRVSINCGGVPAIGGFSFESKNGQKYKTLISQELLAKGFLAGTSVYASVVHDDRIIDLYLDALDDVFEKIRACEDGRDIDELLLWPVSHNGFKRLN